MHSPALPHTTSMSSDLENAGALCMRRDEGEREQQRVSSRRWTAACRRDRLEPMSMARLDVLLLLCSALLLCAPNLIRAEMVSWIVGDMGWEMGPWARWEIKCRGDLAACRHQRQPGSRCAGFYDRPQTGGPELAGCECESSCRVTLEWEGNMPTGSESLGEREAAGRTTHH
jgi:hypothetical protein